MLLEHVHSGRKLRRPSENRYNASSAALKSAAGNLPPAFPGTKRRKPDRTGQMLKCARRSGHSTRLDIPESTRSMGR